MNKIIFFFSVILLISCGGNDKAKVTGTIKNGDGKQLVFEKIENNQPIAVDTVKLDKEGKFEFELPLGKLEFYRMSLAPDNFIVLCLDSTNKTEITADASSLNKTYTIKGSKNSEIIHDFFAEMEPLTKARFDLENQMRGMNFGDTAKVMVMRAQMEDLMNNITTTTKKYIDKYPESPALIVMQTFINPETDLDYLKKIEKAIAKTMPNSPYHNQVSTYISQIEYNVQQMQAQKAMEDAIKPGTPVSEINLPGVDGKPMALSSLKGKVVLVDFWASWCKPCRMENPNVVKLYDKYNKKGFEVFSVSLDKEKDRWVGAIAQDGLKWKYHVSDLMQWNSSVVKQFGITGIPFTLLIDREGKVIDKGLRGPALEQKLAEIFK